MYASNQRNRCVNLMVYLSSLRQWMVIKTPQIESSLDQIDREHLLIHQDNISSDDVTSQEALKADTGASKGTPDVMKELLTVS